MYPLEASFFFDFFCFLSFFDVFSFFVPSFFICHFLIVSVFEKKKRFGY